MGKLKPNYLVSATQANHTPMNAKINMTQLTLSCSSVSGRGEGQGSAVFSGLLLSAAGPGQKSDQKCKGPDIKEEETQRGFCQQTQVIIINAEDCCFIVQIIFYERTSI